MSMTESEKREHDADGWPRRHIDEEMSILLPARSALPGCCGPGLRGSGAQVVFILDIASSYRTA